MVLSAARASCSLKGESNSKADVFLIVLGTVAAMSSLREFNFRLFSMASLSEVSGPMWRWANPLRESIWTPDSGDDELILRPLIMQIMTPFGGINVE